ncbi:MAG: CapA family protein [Lachnospiraceae bacterium]|nr:CapA family protein [Lachnospiraceae bacterium]MDE6980766.1 CapA family protein [Lachnospiraceae bacterium]
MKKKPYTACFLFVVCLFTFLCGCNGQRDLAEAVANIRAKTRPELTVQETEVPESREEQKEDIQEQESFVSASRDAGSIEEMDEAYQVILQNCTSESIGYYPVDEAFLNWLGGEYGDECILKLAEEMSSNTPKKDIWYELTGNSIHVLWLVYCSQSGFGQDCTENVEWKVCSSMSEITLEFTGDVNFSEGYVTTKHMDKSPGGIYDCFSPELLEEMNAADIMMVNNEFTYSTRGKAIPGKAYTFRADPSRVENLKVFGTDIVNVANNHVYDYGPEALLDTLETLDRAGIPHVGAGENLKEASKPYYFVCNGRKIAIVSATQIERSYNYTKEATETSPGVLKSLDPSKFVEVIKEARKNSDYVIVNIHWGTEGDSNFGRDQKNLAVSFARAGADVIIGGHTHCLQGFDFVEGVPVIYSLGNFWFSGSTQDTGLAKVTIDESGKLTLGFVPCIQKNTKTSLVRDEAERQKILDFMQKHSAPGVVVNPDGTISQG